MWDYHTPLTGESFPQDAWAAEAEQVSETPDSVQGFSSTSIYQDHHTNKDRFLLVQMSQWQFKWSGAYHSSKEDLL